MSQRTDLREVFQRYAVHPVFRAADLCDAVRAVFNPGPLKSADVPSTRTAVPTKPSRTPGRA
jgi:hypothetical protein